ncbi:MAG: hypothetical protein J6I40_04040, partial [Mailhella sp.]|nr:hypothetical protein [Mailhella sp.]
NAEVCAVHGQQAYGADFSVEIKYNNGNMVSLKELVELQSEPWESSNDMNLHQRTCPAMANRKHLLHKKEAL